MILDINILFPDFNCMLYINVFNKKSKNCVISKNPTSLLENSITFQ